MKVKEFKQDINNGFGKAIIFLKANQSITHKYFNAIFYACTHNTAYDPQCESSREKYLIEIISLSGLKDALEKKIIETLIETKKFNYDTSQMLCLAKIFAKNGNAYARQAIYNKFLQSLKGNEYVGSNEILELDGEKGLLFIVNAVGERIIADQDYFEDDLLIKYAIEQFGEEKTMDLLNEEAQKNHPVKVYLEVINNYQTETNNEKPLNKTYNEIKDQISKKIISKFQLRFWGRKATQEEIEKAGNDLLEENDHEKLISYLYIFSARDFPFKLDKILNAAKSGNEKLSSVAFRVLKRYKDVAIHDLAVEHIESGTINPEVLDLFEKNFFHSDLEYIEKVFYRDYNDFDYHGIGLSLIHIFEKYKTKKCLNMMVELYKNGRCSSCREWVIDILIDNKILPDWLAQECLYDCNFDIREKTSEYIKNSFG